MGKLAGGAAAGLSANQTQWDWGKGKAFTDGTFATFVCPGWMLGVVQGQVKAGGGDATTGWDFANVFPGGAANWGGSFLTVPETVQAPEGGGSSRSLADQRQVAGRTPSRQPAPSRRSSQRRPTPVSPVRAI